jgi:hypothetical protein
MKPMSETDVRANPPRPQSFEYMLTVQDPAPDSRGRTDWTYPELLAGHVFETSTAAEEYARSIPAIKSPTVVCVPRGFRVTGTPGEMNALEALSNIEMLGTGYKRTLPDVVAIQSVVDMCRRVFHAFRTTRERLLKELLAGVVERANYKQLNRIAITLNVLPQALGDDPFEPDEKVEERTTAKPFAGYGPVPDERGGGNDRLGHRRA